MGVLIIFLVVDLVAMVQCLGCNFVMVVLDLPVVACSVFLCWCLVGCFWLGVCGCLVCLQVGWLFSFVVCCLCFVWIDCV